MDNIPRNEEWHSLSYSNVLKNLNTSSKGLNVTEAGKRLKKEGPISFTGKERKAPLKAAFVYFPCMNRWFHSSPLKAEAWGVSAIVAFSILIVISVEKWIRRKYFNHIKM